MDIRKRTVIALAILFCVANGAYLHRVPGLLGDEGSEGENVYELLHRQGITVVGERSYIGPTIDYLRVPFVYVFGYTALALRVPIFLFSVATFFLAASVLRRSFGDVAGLYALTAFAFSPMYLVYQRLGWAITLFPFFAFLILYLAQRSWQTKWLWIGLAAGLGLANHILFLPTLVGIIAGLVVYLRKREGKIILHSLFLILIGFWAGFGMQFAVLNLHQDDQGDPVATTQLFSERLHDFVSAAPLYISGSSYAAAYTGIEFSPVYIQAITWVLAVLVIAAIALRPKTTLPWLIGLTVHVLVLLYMVDRFSLRYFVVFSLGVWLLAGVGMGSVFERRGGRGGSVILAVVLISLVFFTTFIPFLRTGGSTAEFSLGNRTDTAAAFVDIQPLVACLRGAGPVFSENVHIWNRLQYVSHQYQDLMIVSEENKKKAKLIVNYVDNSMAQQSSICQNLTHFSVRSI